MVKLEYRVHISHQAAGWRLGLTEKSIYSSASQPNCTHEPPGDLVNVTTTDTDSIGLRRHQDSAFVTGSLPLLRVYGPHFEKQALDQWFKTLGLFLSQNTFTPLTFDQDTKKVLFTWVLSINIYCNKM